MAKIIMEGRSASCRFVAKVYLILSGEVLLFYRFLIVEIQVKDHSFTMSPIILRYLSTELSFILLVAL